VSEPEVKEVKRDPNADLALCVGVPAGPYTVELDVTGAPCASDDRTYRGGCLECDEFATCEVGICGHVIKMGSALKSDVTWHSQHRIDYAHGVDPRDGDGTQFTEAAAIAAFIAQGPEPLKHWIERARVAEAKLAQMEAGGEG